MIFKTAYDTTACSGFQMKRTVEALQVALAYGQLRNVPGSSIYLVQGGGAAVNDVPDFAHPVIFHDSSKQEVLGADIRAFGSWNQQQQDFMVRNTIDCAITVNRAKLNQIWIKEERPQLLRDVSPLPMAVFAAWISEGISRRFALDPLEQFKLAMLAAIYYSGLFSNDSTPDEREKMRLAQSVSRATRAKAEDVFQILDEMESIPQNVAEFCAAAISVTKSVRLQDLNAGLLYAILGGTWYGPNAKEVVAVALEHPPTWLSILMAAFSERSYKNSGVTKVSERVGTRANGDDFMRAILNLISAIVDRS